MAGKDIRPLTRTGSLTNSVTVIFLDGEGIQNIYHLEKNTYFSRINGDYKSTYVRNSTGCKMYLFKIMRYEMIVSFIYSSV